MLHPETHHYTGLLTNKERESVTTILALEGLIEKRFYREGYANLGTEVHKLLHAVDMGLKWKAPTIYTRYIPPYQAMLKQTGIKIVDSEVEVEDVLLGVSGTLDKLCLHPVDGYGIMDVKISCMGWTPWTEYQTEGYRSALLWHPKYKGLDIRWRGGIILGPECEIPKLIPHNRIEGISKKWQSIVLGHHAKREAKVLFEDLTSENGW